MDVMCNDSLARSANAANEIELELSFFSDDYCLMPYERIEMMFSDKFFKIFLNRGVRREKVRPNPER